MERGIIIIIVSRLKLKHTPANEPPTLHTTTRGVSLSEFGANLIVIIILSNKNHSLGVWVNIESALLLVLI